jgi:branched-subunit amino acid aminotransferase/4-amino-4-deoxychorismate lyase
VRKKKWARLAAEGAANTWAKLLQRSATEPDFLARIISEGTGKTAWTIAAILNYLKESLKQQSVEGQYAYILWTAETADNVYEVGTDTFVVRDGKIVTQSFTGKITPKG